MPAYVLKRLLSAVPVLLGLTLIAFGIMAAIPGDPATAILGSYATPENVEKLNRDLGLDKPLVQQYSIWLGNMLQGDFGTSFALNRPVLDEVLERFNATEARYWQADSRIIGQAEAGDVVLLSPGGTPPP